MKNKNRTLLVAAVSAILLLLSQCVASAGTRRTIEIRQPDGTYRTFAITKHASRAIVRSELNAGKRSVSIVRLFKADRCVVMRVTMPMPTATDTIQKIRPVDVWQFAETTQTERNTTQKESKEI